MYNSVLLTCALIHTFYTDEAEPQSLNLTTNQTAACLGDYYYLFCTGQEPFGELCRYSTVDWFVNGERLTFPNAKYEVIEQSSTVQVLKFLIAVDEFYEPQSYQCRSGLNCESESIAVVNYSECNIPNTHDLHDRCLIYEAQQCFMHTMYRHVCTVYTRIVLHIMTS